MEETDLERQIEEIEALSSIYVDQVNFRQKENGDFVVEIRISEPERNEIIFKTENPPDYPSKSVPYYEICAPFLRGKTRSDLCGKLEEISDSNSGEMLLYLWVEAIREFVNSLSPVNSRTPSPTNNSSTNSPQASEESPLPEIVTSTSVIEDRRSIFQAHLARVNSAKDVKRVLSKLLENKKIVNATHNMFAYRIRCPLKGVLLSDCDDDGENNAGSRLLHLLDMTEAENVVMIVSRWYGGVLLGPDRFKHINNAARHLLEENGLIQKGSQNLNGHRKSSRG
uniref:UPF0029 protein C27E2.02 n=1 Tax=Caligus rogercresseyi TaxID=217165 RepID=C1BN26_CALRO|nr:UPF0029 protein C27E2.02 [Caligus rogercresseyi]